MESMGMTPMWRGSKEIGQQVQTMVVNFEEFLRDLDLLKKKAP
jgi:hypothetical protein